MPLYGEAKVEYQRKWIASRRQKWIDFKGGRCVECDSTENLEFDHIDRSTKLFEIGKKIHKSGPEMVREVEKCQLLCRDCHSGKTATELGMTHGSGVAGKRNCKCAPCRERKAEYMRDLRRRKREGTFAHA